MFDVELGRGGWPELPRNPRPSSRASGRCWPRRRGGVLGHDDLLRPALSLSLSRPSPMPGATMLSIPSSFTVPTGQAHWHTLMRAAAPIETGCFVFAPAQVGTPPGLQPQGPTVNSIAVAPWGEGGWRMPGLRRRGFVIADIDLAKGRRSPPKWCRRWEHDPEIRRAGAAQAGGGQGLPSSPEPISSGWNQPNF